MIHHLKTVTTSREASRLKRLISVSSSSSHLVTFDHKKVWGLTVNQETGGVNKREILVMGLTLGS